MFDSKGFQSFIVNFWNMIILLAVTLDRVLSIWGQFCEPFKHGLLGV